MKGTFLFQRSHSKCRHFSVTAVAAKAPRKVLGGGSSTGSSSTSAGSPSASKYLPFLACLKSDLEFHKAFIATY